MLATFRGVWRGAGAVLTVIIAGLWSLSPVPDAVLLVAGKEQVLVVRDDDGKLTATGKLSDFWQSHIHIIMGGRAQGLAICTAPDFCTLEMPGGNSLAFVWNRPALGVVCRAGHSYIISAKRPYYPYHSGQTVYYQRLQRGERHLVYLAPDRAKFVSSLYRQPPKWHQPPNSGE